MTFHPSDVPSTPNSRGLADFEAYNRTELPRLVEANLQVMVNAEIAPLEESLKAFLVDIVRRCQSTVAQNYSRIKSSESSAIAAPIAPPNTVSSMPFIEAAHSHYPPSMTVPEVTTSINNISHVQSFFEEPPLLNARKAALTSGSFCHNNAHVPSNNIGSDSGYGTLPSLRMSMRS